MNNLSGVSISKNPSFTDATKEILEDTSGVRNVALKPVVTAVKIAEHSGGDLPENVSALNTVLKKTISILYIAELPYRIIRLFGDLKSFTVELFSGTWINVAYFAKEIFVKISLVLAIVADGIKICASEKWIVISPSVMKVINWIGFFAFLAFSVLALGKIKQQVTIICNSEKDDPKRTLAWIKLASSISLFAIGTFGMITYIFGMNTTMLWLKLIAAASYVAFTIIELYFEKMVVKPVEDKGQKPV